MPANNWISFPLHLSAVTKWDSSIYVCDITGFPFGSLRCETELKVKDIDKIPCDVNGTVEAQSGENVTIRCQAVPGARYRWTKDNSVVSEEESLQLWRVTDAQTGVYTLTVNTGSKTLREEFSIAVVTPTTRPTTGLVTTSSPPIVTTHGSMHSTAISLATTFQPSPSTEQSPTTTSETWIIDVGTDATDPTANTSGAEGSVTPFRDDTPSGVTASATAHTETHRLHNYTTLSSRGADPTQEPVSDESRNESGTPSSNPDDVSQVVPNESSTWGNITEKDENYATERKIKNGKGAQDGERSHLLALIIVPMLLLIVVVGLLVRRHVIKQRMDLPPPFKPPPPPAKYTGAVYKHHEILSNYPVSRCNSLAECI